MTWKTCKCVQMNNTISLKSRRKQKLGLQLLLLLFKTPAAEEDVDGARPCDRLAERPAADMAAAAAGPGSRRWRVHNEGEPRRWRPAASGGDGGGDGGQSRAPAGSSLCGGGGGQPRRWSYGSGSGQLHRTKQQQQQCTGLDACFRSHRRPNP